MIAPTDSRPQTGYTVDVPSAAIVHATVTTVFGADSAQRLPVRVMPRPYHGPQFTPNSEGASKKTFGDMDTQAYLQRIGYNGSVSPTADTLRRLHLAHLRSVPFENLDIILGRPIVLDLDTLYEKIVGRRRGGFCYELNGLFSWLLKELGFGVTRLSARVALEDGGFGPEFDHLTLRVECPADPSLPSAPWLADVGFGDSIGYPLRLDRTGVEQQEGLRAYRIDRDEGFHLLWQLTYDGYWERQYQFTLEPRQFADFEPMYRYHQTSPKSSFTQRRVCTLATPTGRITLSQKKLIITEHGNRRERPVGHDEYQSVLKNRFGVDLEELVIVGVNSKAQIEKAGPCAWPFCCL